jgi:hypothetical protein
MIASEGRPLTRVLAVEGRGTGLLKFDAEIKVYRGGTLQLERNSFNPHGK